VFIEAAEVLTMGCSGFAFKILFSGGAVRQAAEAFSESSAAATKKILTERSAPVHVQLA